MGSGEFLNINFFTALFTLVNTILLFLLLKRYLFGPVMNMIQSRQKEIDDLYAEADCARSDAKAMEDEYKQKLSAAMETSERIVKDAVTRGQAREEEIIRKANQEASAILDKASADIAQEKKKAINDAKDEISVIALAIAGKVVGRELNDTDQSELVDRFISQLGEEV